MFTGLIERMGTIHRVSHARSIVLEIAVETPWKEPLQAGESVAVDGTCLTVAKFDTHHFTADVLNETAKRTTLGEARPGQKVNLERALRAGDRLGGHIVQGHVDGIGTLLTRTQQGRDYALKFRCGIVVATASVLKGSITINGVSLTISGLGNDWLEVNIIPTTARETNLGLLKIGEKVNLESDVLGRYAQRLMPEAPETAPAAETGLTFEKLVENGFC